MEIQVAKAVGDHGFCDCTPKSFSPVPSISNEDTILCSPANGIDLVETYSANKMPSICEYDTQNNTGAILHIFPDCICPVLNCGWKTPCKEVVSNHRIVGPSAQLSGPGCLHWL